MSRRTAAAALVALLVLAGCGGLPAENGTTTDATTEGERVIAAPPSGNQTTEATRPTDVPTTRETTRTTTATYNQDVGYEVRASNANGTAKNVTVRIAPENDSTPVFEESMTLSPNESREFDVEFPHAGAYEVTVEVGDETLTRRWKISVRDPDHGLSVYVAQDGEVHVGFVAI